MEQKSAENEKDIKKIKTDIERNAETLRNRGDNSCKIYSNTESIDKLKRNHNFVACAFLCAVILLNIISTWLIIYRSGDSEFVDIKTMPWFYIVPLVAVMLVNLISIAVWIYRLWDDKVAFRIWEMIMEIVLLIFNTVTIWLFAFHPLVAPTTEVIALAALLMLANATAIIIRLLYFIDNNGLGDFTIGSASLGICIIETLLLLGILVTYISCIRV